MAKQVRPVRRYAGPRVPKRDDVDRCPDLLREVPKRWQGNRAVISALTAALALVSSARSDTKDDAKSRVAPIFVHGEGRGAFGCVAVSPPVFLSEEEAAKVIGEEAKKAGIILTASDAPAVDLSVTTYNVQAKPVRQDDGATRYVFTGDLDLKSFGFGLQMDGADKKKRIAYEYVSYADYNEWKAWRWNAEEAKRMSTAYSIDVRETANLLAGGLRAANVSGTSAVFYDPFVSRRTIRIEKSAANICDPFAVPKGIMDANAYQRPEQSQRDDWRARWAIQEAVALQLAREELRKQVQDFIKWLKAEGVI